jgi:hypothetical protein
MLSGVLGSKQTAYHHSLCQFIDIFEEEQEIISSNMEKL